MTGILMTGKGVGELLLLLALLFGLTYGLAALLARLRIPGILGALFVAMAAHYTPAGELLTQDGIYTAFSLLARLGVLFLLCNSSFGVQDGFVSWGEGYGLP